MLCGLRLSCYFSYYVGMDYYVLVFNTYSCKPPAGWTMTVASTRVTTAKPHSPSCAGMFCVMHHSCELFALNIFPLYFMFRFVFALSFVSIARLRIRSSRICRRHHCRACGHVLCANCTPCLANVPGAKEFPMPSRVCEHCARKTAQVKRVEPGDDCVLA
jgi:hypothetical protein